MRRKKKQEFHCDEQCHFQVMGRRCQLTIGECSGRHAIKSQFCEFHQREEFVHECDVNHKN